MVVLIRECFNKQNKGDSFIKREELQDSQKIRKANHLSRKCLISLIGSFLSISFKFAWWQVVLKLKASELFSD